MPDPSPLLSPQKPVEAETRLWTERGFVVDQWRTLAEDEGVPAEGRVILPVRRWRTLSASVAASLPALGLGIEVEPHDSLDPETDDLGRLSLIALVFPKFTDGRAYSTARRLREVWGYRGELRARGDILLDQMQLMSRCGFDTFEIRNAATIRALERRPPAAMAGAIRNPPAKVGSWRCRYSSPSRAAAAE